LQRQTGCQLEIYDSWVTTVGTNLSRDFDRNIHRYEVYKNCKSRSVNQIKGKYHTLRVFSTDRILYYEKLGIIC
jgi:hypothetical protein